MGEESSHRVNAATLPQWTKSLSVRVVGRVRSVSGGTAVLDTDGNGADISIRTQVNSPLQANKVFEVIGKPIDGQSVQELLSVEFGDDFDLENHNELIRLQDKYPNTVF